MLICVSTPFLIAMLVWLAWRIGARPTDYLSLKPPTRRELARGVIVVAAFLIAGEGLSWLLGQQAVTPFQLDIYRTARSAGWLPWLWLTVVVAAPAGEEILFRGFLFRGWLRASGDARPAIAATSLLWAVLHVQYDFFTMGVVLVLGLLLGWIRARTGSTVLTMILHALVNAEGMVETFLQLRR
jgi:membrane protease YdiL (CAAX protease family)